MFPVVAANTANGNAATTSHTVNLPAGVVAGNLLLIQGGFSGNPASYTFPAGWTHFKTIKTNPVQNNMIAAYKVADGSEGASITITTPGSHRSIFHTWRITGHGAPARVPAASAEVQGSNNLPDPPLHTPAWGTQDYLWLAMVVAVRNITGYPANYPDLRQQNDAGGADTSIGVANRSLRAASDDPGTFLMGFADEWSTIAVSVPPPGGSSHAQVIS